MESTPILIIHATPQDWMQSRIVIDNVYVNGKRRLSSSVFAYNLEDKVKEDWKCAVEIFRSIGGGDWDAKLIEVHASIAVDPTVEVITNEEVQEDESVLTTYSYNVTSTNIVPSLSVTTVSTTPEQTEESTRITFTDETLYRLYTELSKL